MSTIDPLLEALHREFAPRKLPSWRAMLREAAMAHDVSVDDILGPSRTPHVVAARHEAAWLMRKRTKFSLTQIAHRMNRSDHTTVIHSVRRHEERLNRSGAGATAP